MPISPEEISQKQFFNSGDGYDREEVDSFLEVVAADQRALLERIESLSGSADRFGEVGPQVAAVLQRAGDLAERVTSEAELKALETRRRVEEESDMLRKATAEAVDRLRQEAEQYSYEVRIAAERSSREQQLQAADRVGRLLSGESNVREKLYALETTLQAMRGDLREAAETVLPEMRNVAPPLPPTTSQEEPASIIDLREDPVAIGPNATRPSRTLPTNGSSRV